MVVDIVQELKQQNSNLVYGKDVIIILSASSLGVLIISTF